MLKQVKKQLGLNLVEKSDNSSFELNTTNLVEGITYKIIFSAKNTKNINEKEMMNLLVNYNVKNLEYG